MSWWDRMKVRLGLADDDWDEEYYEDEEYYDPDSGDQDDWEPPRGPSYESPYGVGSPGVKRVDRTHETRQTRRADRERVETMRASRSESSLRSMPTGAASVTPVAPQVKMHIAEPKSYAEAQSIADKFKQGTPIIMNMTMTSPDLAKRLIDFASGLTYGLDGNLQKVSEKVFMLTPHNVQVSDADRRRLRDNGVFGE